MVLSESVLTGTPAIRDEVDTDFAKYCRVVDTTDFVHRMFPVPGDTINKVFANLQASGIYDGKRWKDFPPDKARVKEKALRAFRPSRQCHSGGHRIDRGGEE